MMTGQHRNRDAVEIESSYLRSRTLSSQALDLAVTIHLVILEHSELCLLTLVLDLLRCGIHLLLALLGSSTQTKD